MAFRSGAIYSLIALGYTMVYGVLKLINFAHGDVYMVGAFMGYYLANGLGARGAQAIGLSPEDWSRGVCWAVVRWNLHSITALVVMLLAMAICAALGVLIERLRLPAGAQVLTSDCRLITAIGVSLLLENGGQVVFELTQSSSRNCSKSETLICSAERASIALISLCW